MSERELISTLFNSEGAFKIGRLSEEEHTSPNDWSMVGIYLGSKLVAMVDENDLFDEKGNRFEVDQ